MANRFTELAPLFHALSDRTRLEVMDRLAEGSATVGELAAPTGLRLPTVMKHLSVLEEAGLIATEKQGRTRVCSVVPDAMAPLQSWMAAQRDAWEARLVRLDDFVVNSQKDEPE